MKQAPDRCLNLPFSKSYKETSRKFTVVDPDYSARGRRVLFRKGKIRRCAHRRFIGYPQPPYYIVLLVRKKDST